ncbi:MAG: hypothetical protein U0176_25200 [Bacteroidia bacterium]
MIATDPALTLIKGKRIIGTSLASGDTGWVFGSQNEPEVGSLGQGSTPEQAWADFTMKRRAICESFNESLKDDQYGGSSKVVHDSGGVFQMQYGYDEHNFDTTFVFGMDTIECALDAGCWHLLWRGFFRTGRQPSLQPPKRMANVKIVSGTVIDHVQANDSLWLIALFYDKNCMMMGWQNVFLWAWSPKLNTLNMIQELYSGSWEAIFDDESGEQEPGDHLDSLKFRKEKGAVNLRFFHSRSEPSELVWNTNIGQFK